MSSNQIDTTFTAETYVDPFPGKADTDTVWENCYCNGTGYLKHYDHIDGGLCYGCSGAGGTELHVGDERRKAKARVQRRNGELRKTAKAQTAHNERMASYEAQYPELAAWSALMSENEFLMDLWTKAFKWDLSEKQVAAAAKSITGKAEREAARAAEQAARADAPVGKVTVTGTVKSVKFQENDFGGAWKMVVEGEGGFKVWSTVPSKMIDAVMAEQDELDKDSWAGWSTLLVGRTVSFTATLEASDDDASFAFAKRPTKAVIL
jgi:hypothetical protein